MRNSKRVFILIEGILAAMVVILICMMAFQRNGKDLHKISVIIQNSDDNQWSAFKYGLEMAAEDAGVEMIMVSTGNIMTVEEQKRIIEQEIENGADAMIVQPVSGSYTQDMLRDIEKKVPVILVETAAVSKKEESELPLVQPDNYEMGKLLGEELLKDYNGNLEGKTFGIVGQTQGSESVISRRDGFLNVLKDSGASISWSLFGISTEGREESMKEQERTDFVIALDDDSLTVAGKYAASNNLHGAIIYGIGNSTESIYYLDTGAAECLVVPDEFNVGYQSLTEAAEILKHSFHKPESGTVSYTVLRRDTLFLEENQEILFTMSQ